MGVWFCREKRGLAQGKGLQTGWLSASPFISMGCSSADIKCQNWTRFLTICASRSLRLKYHTSNDDDHDQNNNNSCHLLSTYHVPGTILSLLQLTTLQSQQLGAIDALIPTSEARDQKQRGIEDHPQVWEVQRQDGNLGSMVPTATLQSRKDVA